MEVSKIRGSSLGPPFGVICRGFFFGVFLEAIFRVGFVKCVEVSCYDCELSRVRSYYQVEILSY